QRIQALRGLLHGLIEGLRGRMAMFAQHLVLGQPQAVNRAHEHPALPGQVAEDLLLERGFKEIARADGKTACQAAVQCPARRILVDGIAAVDPLALEEEAAYGRSRTFGGYQDNVDVPGWNDTGLIAVGDAEAVRKIKRLAGL